jgi:hypothetical protein
VLEFYIDSFINEFDLFVRDSTPQLSRHTRQRLFMATGVLSLALWLLLTVAEAYSPLHAWMHGGAIPDNDDCAVALLAHGSVHTEVADVPLTLPMVWVVSTPHVDFSVFCPTIGQLPSGRAPPVLPAVS